MQGEMVSVGQLQLIMSVEDCERPVSAIAAASGLCYTVALDRSAVFSQLFGSYSDRGLECGQELFPRLTVVCSRPNVCLSFNGTVS